MQPDAPVDHTPLRILWVASKLSWHGGIGRVVAGATAELARRGHDVHVAGPAPDGPPGPHADVTSHPWTKGRLKLMQLVRLIPLVRELRPQIIHFHSALPHGEVISGIRALRRLLGDPCIFATPHTAARANYPKRRARLGLRAADIIVTPSSWSAEQAIKAGARPASTRVVYAGIDLPKESRADQRSHNVLALGRLVKTKGISVLIDAFAEAAASRPDWRLEIGGAGAEEASLRAAAAAAACADRIDFLGYIRGETKSGALGRASIGAVPSFKESFGGTLLEFQAQGLACVASHVGGMVELACQGRAARSVPAGDAPALAKALGELMDDPSQRARLGEAAREFASGLNWSAAGDAYEALYREQLALR